MAGIEDSEELESILQCPVCLEIPKSTPIHQCDRGHHICVTCFQKIRAQSCPVCKAAFYGTRNFIAEELIKIFPRLTIQTASATVPSAQTNEVEVPVNLAPPLCRGLFPCLFSECNRNLGAGRMLQHIRNQHRPFLVEVSARKKYTEEWEFHHALYSTFVEAIRIANMGLFFLVVDIDENGLFHAVVQMVATEDVAAKFKFKMRILDVNKETKMSFNNQVFSCYNYIKHLATKGHCLEFNTKKCSYLRSNSLICSVTITDERQ